MLCYRQCEDQWSWVQVGEPANIVGKNSSPAVGETMCIWVTFVPTWRLQTLCQMHWFTRCFKNSSGWRGCCDFHLYSTYCLKYLQYIRFANSVCNSQLKYWMCCPAQSSMCPCNMECSFLKGAQAKTKWMEFLMWCGNQVCTTWLCVWTGNTHWHSL